MLVTDRIRIDSAYRQALAACQLHQVGQVLERVEGRIVAWSRTTDTLYVESPGSLVGFCVKRYFYPRLRHRLRGVLRGTLFGWHRAAAEARLLRAMREAGSLAVRPVAYGSRRCGGFLAACFLITEAVPEARNLTSFALDVEDGRESLSIVERRRLLRTLAEQVGELHASGFSHGQLFWRNLLLRRAPAGGFEFFLLDARPGHGQRRLAGGRWWVEELAQLCVSAEPFTSRTERLRFLLAYAGVPRLTESLKQDAREAWRMSRRWERHERQRIRMCRRFDAWSRRLEAERAAGAPAVESSHAG